MDGAPIIILLFPMFALPGGVFGLMIAFVQTRRNDGVHGLLYLFGGVVGGLIAVNIFGSQQFLVEVIVRGVVGGLVGIGLVYMAMKRRGDQIEKAYG